MPKPRFKLALFALLITHPANITFAAFGDQLWQWIDSDAVTSLAASNGTILVGSYTASFRKGKATLLDASTGTNLRTLIANDGERLDFFGWSVDIDSGIAAIGATRDDSGAYSGSAYLFDVETGEQFFKFEHQEIAEERSGNRLGYSISISGETVFAGIGSARNFTGGYTGGAYVLDTSGNKRALVTPSGGNPFHKYGFGHSVAIDGELAIMGGNERAKVVDITTNEILRPLKAKDRHFDDGFGHAVALDGKYAAVTAYLDDERGEESGTAYVFDVTTGELISELIPEDGSAESQFGNAVAIEGNLALVGAKLDDEHGINSGAAYLFDINTGEQLAKLTPNDLGARDAFGSAVALSDGIAYITSPWRTVAPLSGSVYAFDARPIPEPSTLIYMSLALLLITTASTRSSRLRSL